MKNKLALIFIFCLCYLPSLAEEPVFEQKTYLKAGSAKVVPKDDHVLIIVEKLDSTASYGVEIKANVPYIEAWKLVTVNGQTFASFPPTTLKPDSPGEFNLLGKKGDRFGLSFRAETTFWKEITIAGDDPSSPPPEDTSEIVKIADEAADKVNDPETRRALISAFKSALALTDNKTLEECKTLITNSRRLAFQLRGRDLGSKDWESWKLAVDKVLKTSTKEEYLASYRAVIKGLEQ